MRKYATVFTSVLTAFAILLTCSLYAQDNKKEQKEKEKALDKKENKMDGKIKEKALKPARQEAKKLTKQGCKVTADALPMEKQLENAWEKQYETDDLGYPK